MNRTLSRLSAIILAICLVAGITVSVSAVTPTQSYTYWYDVSNANKAVYNKPMYEPERLIEAIDIGVEAFAQINDITTDKSGNLYILDSMSRIVIIDDNYNLIREIGLIDGIESYNNAARIYVHTDNTIYICDTEGHRVLHITPEGTMIETIVLPDSPLIPDDFEYRPTAVAKDQYGYVYVLSEGSYYGALLYAPDMSFVGFYGSNTVSASVGTVLTNIQNRVFPNNTKLSKEVRKLPFSFVDIEINDEGFIYTCNGFVKGVTRGEIRKLSPGTGSNILSSSNVKFTDDKLVDSTGRGFGAQNLTDVEVDSKGFIYSIELQYGRIFMYDDECRTITVFGGGMGEGSQLGTFVTVSGLALKNDGEKVIVSDSTTNGITVFNINEYGKQAKNVIYDTIEGNYDNVKQDWEEVLTQDINFQPAYSGLARVYLNEGDYETAMKYAKLGYDRETYAVAYEYVRKDLISENFVWFFAAIVVAVVGIIAFLVISTKKKLRLIKNHELHVMFTTMIHPANNFTDIKEKHYGSIGLSLLLVLVYYVVTVLQTLAGGFLFTTYDPASFNSLWILLRTVGLVALWVCANWLVCTLLGGKGKFKEIIVVTCYSLLPIIIEKLIRLALTNVLLPAEASFLSILDTIAMLYFGLMLIIGLIKIHDFEIERLVSTCLLSVLGIAVIVFLMIMVIILVQQFWGFILTVGSEILTL